MTSPHYHAGYTVRTLLSNRMRRQVDYLGGRKVSPALVVMLVVERAVITTVGHRICGSLQQRLTRHGRFNA